MTKKRGGFTIIETLVAGIILATAFAVATQMLIAAATQRKALGIRQTALIEAGNVMERLAAEPWPKLEAKELGVWKLSPQAAHALPDAKLEIQIKPIPGKPAAKRVTVIVSHGGGERPAREVRLVVWRYGHKTEDRGQRTEDRGQRAEDGK